jgi:hypothetical protein
MRSYPRIQLNGSEGFTFNLLASLPSKFGALFLLARSTSEFEIQIILKV